MDTDVFRHEDQVDDEPTTDEGQADDELTIEEAQEDAKLTISKDQVFDGLPVSICLLMTFCEIVPCETNFSKPINMDADEVGHQESKSTKNVSDDLSIHQENDAITIDADIKDDVSVSTLDISLCQAYEKIFGDGDVPNMVVPPNTDLFQQPLYLQSSEHEIDFIPPLDIQLHQAYEEIFDDPGVSTMLSTSDEGLFHQPFHLQPDEYEIDFANIQDHEPIENSAFLSSTICHDLGEINQVDWETHLGPDGEIHLVKDMTDGETHLYKQDRLKFLDGETYLHKDNIKVSNCLGHDIGLVKPYDELHPYFSSDALPCESAKITSSSASNGDPSLLDHLLRDRSTSAFSKTGYAHGKGIHPLFTMINILIWLWGATRVKRKKILIWLWGATRVKKKKRHKSKSLIWLWGAHVKKKKKKHKSKSLSLLLHHKKPPDPISFLINDSSCICCPSNPKMSHEGHVERDKFDYTLPRFSLWGETGSTLQLWGETGFNRSHWINEKKNPIDNLSKCWTLVPIPTRLKFLLTWYREIKIFKDRLTLLI
ncbi:hypothetical protein ACA910_011566 [Epithemia clementina (nom. ined.)]